MDTILLSAFSDEDRNYFSTNLDEWPQVAPLTLSVL